MPNFILAFISFTFLFHDFAHSKQLRVGEQAPMFQVKNHKNENFNLDSRKGKWTVLYFYPKADTPGCTKQACAFRDSISQIRELNAEVYGISVNSVEDQLKFHKKYKLNFDLLADYNGDITKQYGTKMKIVNLSKRWTFILDPQLRIRSINKDVDPVKDAEAVASELKKIQSKTFN